MQLGGGLGRLIDDLAGEALNSHLRNVRSHAQLRRRIADGDLSEREVNQAYSEYARSTAGTYRKAAADLTLRYYEELSELGARYSDDFFRQILETDIGAPPRARRNGHARVSADDEEQRVPIELHGRAGHEIVSAFAIENTDPIPAHVQFEFDLCRAPHGQTFHAPITIQPAVIDLEPGGTAEVLLRVALMPSVFLPGMIYRQAIRAVGGKPLTLDVTFWVEAEDDPLQTAPATDVERGAPHGDAPTTEPSAPRAEKPATKRAVTKKPATKRAVTKKSATKRAVTKKSATKKSATKRAATKASTAQSAGQARSATRPRSS